MPGFVISASVSAPVAAFCSQSSRPPARFDTKPIVWPSGDQRAVVSFLSLERNAFGVPPAAGTLHTSECRLFFARSVVVR